MNKYETINIVGEGAYGVVSKAKNKETGEIVAIKKFKESEEDEIAKKTIMREVKMLRLLQHQNIVALREAFKNKGRLYLVFEYIDRNLLEVLEDNVCGIDPKRLRLYVYQMVKGAYFCHKNNVIHRDIKPENLLINPKDNSLKLCDFGFSRPLPPNFKGPQFEGGKMTDYVATRWYRSPELLLGYTDYGPEVDMWAIGCIMGELSDGQPLFPGDSEMDMLYLFQKVLGPLTDEQMQCFMKNPRFQGLKFPEIKKPETLGKKYMTSLSKKALSLMKGLLIMDPAERITGIQALKHIYFDDIREPEIEQEIKLYDEKAAAAAQGKSVAQLDSEAAPQAVIAEQNKSASSAHISKKSSDQLPSQLSQNIATVASSTASGGFSQSQAQQQQQQQYKIQLNNDSNFLSKRTGSNAHTNLSSTNDDNADSALNSNTTKSTIRKGNNGPHGQSKQHQHNNNSPMLEPLRKGKRKDNSNSTGLRNVSQGKNMPVVTNSMAFNHPFQHQMIPVVKPSGTSHMEHREKQLFDIYSSTSGGDIGGKSNWRGNASNQAQTHHHGGMQNNNMVFGRAVANSHTTSNQQFSTPNRIQFATYYGQRQSGSMMAQSMSNAISTQGRTAPHHHHQQYEYSIEPNNKHNVFKGSFNKKKVSGSQNHHGGHLSMSPAQQYKYQQAKGQWQQQHQFQHDTQSSQSMKSSQFQKQYKSHKEMKDKQQQDIMKAKLHINSRQQFVIEEEAHHSQKSSEDDHTHQHNLANLHKQSDSKIQNSSHKSNQNLNSNKDHGQMAAHGNNQLHFIKSKNGSPKQQQRQLVNYVDIGGGHDGSTGQNQILMAEHFVNGQKQNNNGIFVSNQKSYSQNRALVPQTTNYGSKSLSRGNQLMQQNTNGKMAAVNAQNYVTSNRESSLGMANAASGQGSSQTTSLANIVPINGAFTQPKKHNKFVKPAKISGQGYMHRMSGATINENAHHQRLNDILLESQKLIYAPPSREKTNHSMRNHIIDKAGGNKQGNSNAMYNPSQEYCKPVVSTYLQGQPQMNQGSSLSQFNKKKVGGGQQTSSQPPHSEINQ